MRGTCFILWVVVLAACNQDNRSPLQVAQDFQLHLQRQEFESVMPLVVDSTRESLRFLVADARQFPIEWPDSSRIITDTVVIDENTAVVWMEYWQDSYADTSQIRLVREGTSWRVVFLRHDPIHVARSFLTAFHAGVWQESARYTDKASLRDLEVAAQYYKGWQGPAVTIEGLIYNEDHSKAFVSYREKGNDMTKRIHLVMDDEGHWKVSFSKKAIF